MMRQEIEELSLKYGKIFEDCSDAIWATPETNFTEHKSCAAAKKVMEELGFKVTWPVQDMDTAFIAEAGSGKPVIAILGEIDALPGLSAEADNPCRVEVEEGGNGHGCGHNLLGAGAMETAYLLKLYMEERNIAGTVRYYCCPAEEGGVGKVFMINRGVFDDVDFTISWHPGGQFGITHAAKSIYISNFRFHGKTAHAAGNPYNGRSALDALELMNVSIQFLREHLEKDVFVHYAITNSGGRAANVVQDYAEGSYVVRAKDNTQLKDAFRRVTLCGRGAAIATETEMEEPEIVSAFSSFIDNATLADVMRENIKAVMPVEYTEEELEYAKKFQAIGNKPDDPNPINQESIREDGASSTDVADVSWVTPLVYLSVPTLANGTSGHHWTVTAQGKSAIAHKGLHIAAKIMANTCLDILDKPEIIDKAKEEFLKNLGGKTYAEECLMPKDRKPTPIY